jgi:hypothetical protein
VRLANELMAMNYEAESEAVIQARAEYHARLWPECIKRLPEELARKRPNCVSCQVAGRNPSQSVYKERGHGRIPLAEKSGNTRKRKDQFDTEKMAAKVTTLRSKFGCINCKKVLCRKREGCWTEHLSTL